MLPVVGGDSFLGPALTRMCSMRIKCWSVRSFVTSSVGCLVPGLGSALIIQERNLGKTLRIVLVLLVLCQEPSVFEESSRKLASETCVACQGHLTEFAWLWPQTTAMMGAVKHHLKAAGKVHPKLMFSGAVQFISASLGRGPLTSSSQGFTQT